MTLQSLHFLGGGSAPCLGAKTPLLNSAVLGAKTPLMSWGRKRPSLIQSPGGSAGCWPPKAGQTVAAQCRPHHLSLQAMPAAAASSRSALSQTADSGARRSAEGLPVVRASARSMVPGNQSGRPSKKMAVGSCIAELVETFHRLPAESFVSNTPMRARARRMTEERTRRRYRQDGASIGSFRRCGSRRPNCSGRRTRPASRSMISGAATYSADRVYRTPRPRKKMISPGIAKAMPIGTASAAARSNNMIARPTAISVSPTSAPSQWATRPRRTTMSGELLAVVGHNKPIAGLPEGQRYSRYITMRGRVEISGAAA